jgi:uncharacterized damage-inducible protein DinB
VAPGGGVNVRAFAVATLEPSRDEVRSPLVAALQAHLASLAAVMATLDAATYRAAAAATSGTIGAHVRHALDHARALLSGVQAGAFDYDARRRGTAIEAAPAAALAEIDTIIGELDQLDDDALVRPAVLMTLTHRDAPPSLVETTVAREVAFVTQHTVHHCALVALLLERLGVGVPADFSMAPSTPLRRQ